MTVGNPQLLFGYAVKSSNNNPQLLFGYAARASINNKQMLFGYAQNKDITGAGFWSSFTSGLKSFGRKALDFGKKFAPVIGDLALKYAPTAIDLGVALANQEIDKKNKLFGKTDQGREGARSTINLLGKLGKKGVDFAAKRKEDASKAERADAAARELIDGSGFGMSEMPGMPDVVKLKHAKKRMRRKLGKGLMPY